MDIYNDRIVVDDDEILTCFDPMNEIEQLCWQFLAKLADSRLADRYVM